MGCSDEMLKCSISIGLFIIYGTKPAHRMATLLSNKHNSETACRGRNERLKLEGETENMGVWTKQRGACKLWYSLPQEREGWVL